MPAAPGGDAPRADPCPFDAYYYANCCGRPYQRDDEWLAAFGRIAERIQSDFDPQSVMDAGCAIGLLVEALRTRGVEAWGVDLSSWAIEHAHASIAPFCRCGSIAEPFGRRYDLIVCIEVVEHMPAMDAETAIANICAHSDNVLFSSSPHDYREPTHINVHPPEHWSELFARHGLLRDVDYDARYIAPWAVRYRRSSEPMHRVVRNYERRFVELAAAAGQSRDYATELQARVAHLEREVSEVRAALGSEIEHCRALIAHLEGEAANARAQHAAELEQGRQHATELQERAAHLERELTDARGHIQQTRELLARAEARAIEAEAMKRSPFWKLRNLAVKLLRR